MASIWRHFGPAISSAAMLLSLSPPARGEVEIPSKEELSSLGSAVVSALPSGTALLAVCGPSSGNSYFVSPEHSGWERDQVSKGRIIVIASPAGEPNIIFQDALGEFLSARADGAEVTFSFIDGAKQSFGLIEHYKSTGVTQTYAFTTSKIGEKLMLWTSTKAHVGVANITKVSAFKSYCV